MIKREDLEAAIAECQGKRNPDARTCIMLAAFYTIRNEMYGSDNGYSFSPSPTINIGSDSEFARAINGRQQEEIFPVMDELMDTLAILQPRLYNAVLNKLS